jgi:hypothetical protein
MHISIQQLTMLKAREKGRPWSRANDQVIRDAAAKQPIALQNSKKMMMAIMIVAPALDPTAVRKMRTKAAVAASESLSSSWMFSALNSTAKSIPKASEPLMIKLSNIDRGTSVLAFLTSSDICMREMSVTVKPDYTNMDHRIRSDKCQSIALQAHEECQSLRWPLPAIVEGREYDFGGIVVPRQVDHGY